MDGPTFNVVLREPQIPNNTGNIGRTCMATDCRLHVVHPIGFQMDEKARRRAGMDYWDSVDCREHASWEAFLAEEAPQRIWLCTTRATRCVWDAQFQRGDYLLFGSEGNGVPPAVHDWVEAEHGPDARLRLPMEEGARSLNLATAVCAVVYEGMRQLR